MRCIINLAALQPVSVCDPSPICLEENEHIGHYADAGVMGLMSVWVGGLDKPCTGQFGASAMSYMPMQTTAAAEHPLKNGDPSP